MLARIGSELGAAVKLRDGSVANRPVLVDGPERVPYGSREAVIIKVTYDNRKIS